MDDKYKELREALAAGPTAGPWKAESRVGDWVICQEFDGHALAYPDPSRGEKAEKNAVFISHASPATIQALLAERDALRDALRIAHDSLRLLEASANDNFLKRRAKEGLEAARAALALSSPISERLP